MSLVVGTKLLWRASRELRARRQEARSSFRRKSFSSIELQARSRDIESSDHTQPNAEVNISKQRRRKSINKFKTSRGRLIQYFAGIRPLVADEEDDVDSASRGTNEGSEEHRETNASSSEQLPDAAITELLGEDGSNSLPSFIATPYPLLLQPTSSALPCCRLCVSFALSWLFLSSLYTYVPQVSHKLPERTGPPHADVVIVLALVIEAAKTNRRDEVRPIPARS